MAFKIKPSRARGIRKEIGRGDAELGCRVGSSPITLTFAIISDSEYELEMQLFLYSDIIFHQDYLNNKP